MTPKAHRKRWVTDAIANFPGTDADGFGDLGDEDLAVADLALGEEVEDVPHPPVEFGVPLLATEALDLGHRQALDPHGRKRFTHIVRLEGFYYGSDQFHDDTS